MPGRLAAFGILLAAASLCGAAAPEQWFEVGNAHFRVVTDSREPRARQVLDEFERIRSVFQGLLRDANGDPIEPIVVVAAKNTRSFRALEPATYLAAGQMQLAGVFARVYDKNYVLLRLDATFEHAFAPVYHEYTHLQLSGESDWLPLWVNEGLAEFFQTAELHGRDTWLGAAIPENVLYLRQHQLMPLRDLFRVDRGSPYYHEEQKGSVFYAESWALIHYLEAVDRQRGAHRLMDYLDLVHDRADPVAAAERTFGDLRELEIELDSYIRAGHYARFAVSGEGGHRNDSDWLARRLTEVEADAVRADVLAAVGREREARELAESVLKMDPGNAQPCETMAMLEYRAGNRDAARRWYGDAIARKSENYFAWFNFANLSMSDEKQWADPRIEDSLRAAVRLNPRYYPASEFLATLLDARNRGNEAIAVMRDAERAAASEGDAEKAKARITRLEESVAARKALAAKAAEMSTPAATPATVSYDPAPKHPDSPRTAPKHSALGIIRGVHCDYPAVIEFRLEGRTKMLSLYINDYTAMDYTAIGWLPTGKIHPCEEFEGMHVKVRYAESPDKTVDG